MTIILALMIPVSIAITGFLCFKAVQLGLRWQIETKQEQQPTMEVKNPISEIIQNTHTYKQEKQQASVVSEWLNGPEER